MCVVRVYMFDVCVHVCVVYVLVLCVCVCGVYVLMCSECVCFVCGMHACGGLLVHMFY